jgi:hypothetical protein
MRLGHYRIDLSAEPPQGEPRGPRCTSWVEKYRAELAVSDEFLAASPADRRYTMVHELLHVHLAPLSHRADDLVEHLPKKARDGWETALYRDEELIVDALAQLIAPFMPLPD